MIEFLQLFFIFFGCMFTVAMLLIHSYQYWQQRRDMMYSWLFCIISLVCATAIIMALWRI